jgi:putative pyruvate formate lyase activating enzyme
LLDGRCLACPRLCKVDRLADEPGLCRFGGHAVVASYFPHFGEENCLRGWRGSGTMFFSGCNLREIPKRAAAFFARETETR